MLYFKKGLIISPKRDNFFYLFSHISNFLFLFLLILLIFICRVEVAHLRVKWE